MTYWPISSPSVFAATKHTNPARTHVSDDGAGHKQPGQGQGGSDDGSQPQVEDESLTTEKSGLEEKNGAQPRKTSGSAQLAEDDIHGEIIAIRVTRSGHMFATLTKSTLTIWQTKARCHYCSIGLLLIVYVAYSRPSLRIAIRTISTDVRPKYRHSSSS